jgi:hypothetical protein
MIPTSLTRRTAAAMFGGAVLLGTLAVGTPAASAKAGDVRVSARCSGSTRIDLKLGKRDGGIETEVEVDSNRNGQRWTVRMRDDGVLVLNSSRVTQAPSGSFSIEKHIADRAGTDSVVAVADNPSTGEHCSVAAKI